MKKVVVLLFILASIAACQTKQERQTASTKAMIAELDTIAAKARKGAAYPYFTDKLLKSLKMGIVGLPYDMKQGSWLDLSLVLLLRGDNDECIELINNYLEGNGTVQVTESNVQFQKVKALAYLRKGEINNCIQNHTGQSCIMPIQEDGIHIDKEPVSNAIEVYANLLAYDSTDLQSKWFLNLCYMAVGQYPDQVPSQHLIPTKAFQSETDFPTFKNISMELGVDVNNHAGGASIEDFNNDGLLDIFTTSYSLAEPSKLFINQGGTFVDQTIQYGLEGLVGGLNNIHADFNNDGLIDIYVMRGAWLNKNGQIPNSLLINQGGSFSDETKSSGLYFKGPTGAVATADFNLDGHLDLFVGNEYTRSFKVPSYLYLNNGNQTFTDISDSVGLNIKQYVKGANWADINNDGLPDLFISVYGGQNKLYVNRGGKTISDWKFDDIAISAGVIEPLMSFTTWFWDYNQDGLQDIIVFGYDNIDSFGITSEVFKDYTNQDFKGETPRLYQNNGDETFSNVTEEVGLDRLLYVMGGNTGDFNNDGYPDMYLGTGEFNIWASIPNRAFLNNQGNQFLDVTSAGEFGQIQKGHGVAFGDLDNDGDQDIYHQVGGAAESDVFQNMLLENPGFDNQWISIGLEGKTANKSAIGAKIRAYITQIDGTQKTLYYTVTTGGSFGANTLRLEMGLGKTESLDSLMVIWPDTEQSEQKHYNIMLNQHYTLKQGGSLKISTVTHTPFQTQRKEHQHHKH